MTRRYERPVTPAEIGKELLALGAELVPGGVPLYVDMAPIDGAPPNECFLVVDEKVKRDGGKMVVGWALWELPTVFIEAEFHAVWLSPDGEYVDVSPKNTPTARVLFLPDPTRQYAGRPLDNVRRATGRDPAIRTYLEGFEAMFELMNRGERATVHGEIRFAGAEADEYHEIAQRIAQAQFHIQKLFPVVGAYSPCWCGSGKKLKWCHRE